VINRLPLLGTIVESIGIVTTGLFFYRNLWTSSKRQATFERASDTYQQAISGNKTNVPRVVAPIEDVEELVETPQVQAVESPTIASTPQPKSNGVDELRYLFLASQVELIDDASKIQGLQHQTTSASSNIGVVTAEGVKCDRCWNYSPTIGHNSEHPLICDRCVDALTGDF
jgi:isoleucyl-tRNA synthetase